jgi:hypothetical protein
MTTPIQPGIAMPDNWLMLVGQINSFIINTNVFLTLKIAA